MKKQSVTIGLLVGGFIVAVLWVVLFRTPDDGSGTASERPTSDTGSTLPAGDGRLLGPEGRTGVVFTEFLDFECEACGAAYPFIEDLREEYQGEVTFEARYFPLPNHVNSRNAAAAVESAHRQGEMEAMYQRMFETQTEWGESQDSKADLFRTYAEEIGLDMEQYDADVSSEVVQERVQADVDAGTRLGVQGTPTFFIDGELFEPRALDDFAVALDEAVAQAQESR